MRLIYDNYSAAILFIITLIQGMVYCDDFKSDQGLVIKLQRQKTARYQFLNSKNYGVSFDWLHKGGKRTNDSIALYRYLDNEFYGKIEIGHPGQTLNVAFDTAWYLTWVMSKKCDKIRSIGCWFHNTYDHDRSSEYKPDGRRYIINEGSYNLTGIYSYENISISHSNVTNQSFVEMETVPWTFLFNKADGVLGLGRKTGDYVPFFYTLYNQNKIANRIFSIYLNRDPLSAHGGNVMLGYVEKRHIAVNDTIKYLDVSRDTYFWEFTVDKIYVGTNADNAFVLCGNSCKAITDTSTNNIIGPVDDIKRINAEIGAEEFLFGYYTVPCDTVTKLAKVTFSLGGRNFTISSRNYIQKMSLRLVSLCVSAFQPASADFEKNVWFLGGAFLSEYYSIYNIANNTIGFVRAA